MASLFDGNHDPVAGSVLGAHRWYPYLANHTFPTSFVRLRDSERRALAQGLEKGSDADRVIRRLEAPMRAFPGNCFVFTETTAPTDTVRFERKRGAVHSAGSAWRILCSSRKTCDAAASGCAEFICIRPFRRMNRAREFRLFVRDGRLLAMSQYWLVGHFRLLDKAGDAYWQRAKAFVEEIAWTLPVATLVIDLYFTSDDQILIIDLNPWGPPTSPLLLKAWDIDWDSEPGFRRIAVPTTISGDVSVSF
jgi:hypothetical protein